MQKVWSYYKPLLGVGDGGLPIRNAKGEVKGGAGGMSGTASRGGLRRILAEIASHVEGYHEFVDIGAGDGVVLAAALAFMAMFAFGIEIKDEGQACVWKGAQSKVLVPWGIEERRCGLTFGKSITQCSKLPSLQGSAGLPVCVFAFCDGFVPKDRAHMFHLVGANGQVQVFMCSLGMAGGDPFSTAKAVLTALNASSRALPKFRHIKQPIKIQMFASPSKKWLHTFVRAKKG
jgi:hypothetical protein